MKISVIGTGYVGLVTGACLAEMGNDVVCVDVDERKIGQLKADHIPIYEPSPEEMVAANMRAERLSFTTDMDRAVAHAVVIFIAVGTPPDEDGSADVTHVEAVARSIGQRMTDYKVIVDKSTVPVGTADKVRPLVSAELNPRKIEARFSVVSNPEFQKEVSAVNDFMRRPRRRRRGFRRFGDRRHAGTLRAVPARPRSAAGHGHRLGRADEIRRQRDARDAHRLLIPLCGMRLRRCMPAKGRKGVDPHGGTRAAAGHPEAIESVKERQKGVLARNVVAHFGEDLRNRRFALWGLAFKPNTDEMREAPNRSLIRELLQRGATLSAYDPVAMGETKKLYSEESRVELAGSALAACTGADALLIVTKWKEFRSPDLAAVKSRLRGPIVFDGRNRYAPSLMGRAGLDLSTDRTSVRCDARIVKIQGGKRPDEGYARCTRRLARPARSNGEAASRHEMGRR